MPLIDLHCHTTASDGVASPTELVRHAAERGVGIIAITDHDTVAGIDEALRVAAEVGVRVIPGVELSTRWDTRDVHVLGLFIDHRTGPLLEALERRAGQREQRAIDMVDRLRELGHDISIDDVRKQAAGAILARPHVARALVARGVIPDVRSAFTPELIGDGGLANVARFAPSSVDAVGLIRAAGGAAVLAHPGVGHHEGVVQPLAVEAIAELTEAGLAGLEVDHPDHPPLIRDRLNAIADEYGLIPTGGSDWHTFDHTLGGWSTSIECFERLEAAAATT